MEELGEAAKMWVNLKIFECYVGLFLLPFFVIFMWSMIRKHKNDFWNRND